MPIDGVEDDTSRPVEGNVTVRLSTYDKTSVTRSGDDVPTQVPCNRFNLSIFDEYGNKVASEAQKYNDNDFGKMSFNLSEGTYTIVAIGHSKDNSVPISNMNKVEFSGGLTDVFYCAASLKVDDEPQTLELNLKRAVGVFQLAGTDKSVPSEIAQLQFKYTGGSQNFNPSNGYGCTKSTQTENREISISGRYNIYTFPREDSNTLNITLYGKDSNEETVFERVFENVPIQVNVMTVYTGEIFNLSSFMNKSTVNITVDRSFDAINDYNF